MSVHRTIENNEEVGIRQSKTYKSFVAAVRGHWELNFIEKYVRNYITREVRNVLKLEDAKEFGKYLLRIKENNRNFFFELKLEVDQSIKIAFWADARSRAACEYFGDVILFHTTYNAKQCLLFESRGILCCHALSVLRFERVNKVSPRYILERWSKNVKRRHTHIKSSLDEPLLEPRSKRFDKLVFCLQNICEFASESEERTAIMHCAYDNDMVEMQEQKAKSNKKYSLSHEDANLEAINELQSPPNVRTRGRPKNRLGSKMEKHIANGSKKKKMKALSEVKVVFFKQGG
ncbi:hypothetical protein Ahy_A03g011482 [Arachis hypogaea]|uniref:Uncharacterized protein n=1 Tax=Arachis hypogaea TaxID=3818 RepID=A0A445DQV7_ARAHY|nr:hypothetical protein Ahy_A03g011482 [Arachis hypogaea]